MPTDADGDHNVAGLLERIAAQVPEREAIVTGQGRWTWVELTDRSRRLAAVLASAGIGLRHDPGAVAPWESPHDHVALYLYNGNEYLEGMLGAWQARSVAININYRYVAAELAYVLRDSAARAIIVDDRFASTLAEVLPELPEVKLVLQVRAGGSDAEPAGERHLLPSALDYEEALDAAEPREPEGLSPDDRYIVYTGGTTGMPKGVLWRQGDFLAGCLGVSGSTDELAAAAASEGRDQLRTLPAAPLMHGAAHWNAMAALAAGGTVVFPQDPTRLDAADVLATCERERVLSLQIVGDAFAQPLLDELSRRPYDMSALGLLISGGAILSPAAKAAWNEAVPGARILDVLGSSETGRQAMDASGDSSGKAAFSLEARAAVVSGDRTRRLSPGEDEVGWLAQWGRVPLGYLGDPTKTQETFPEIEGVRYAVAGDRAKLGADGALQFLGRHSAVVNTGGEKVYAEEVEQVLKGHPGVADALVVGRPNPRWGQEVVAVVMPSHDGSAPAEPPDEDELRDHCRQALAGYKLPKAIFWVDQIQRSPSGKPDYKWARKLVDAASPAG